MNAIKQSVLENKEWRLREWFQRLSDNALSQLKLYQVELLRFNQRINLISSKTEKNADLVHFADSIMGSELLLKNSEAEVIHDIGSGNGFPGLVLAVLAPERRIVAIDSDARKIEFIKHVAASLGLKNVEARQSRLEDLPADSVECAVSRAFSSISKSILLSRKASMMGADYFHFKGDAWVRELADIPSQICSVWAPRLIGEYVLPDKTTRLALIATKKIGN